MDNSDLWKLEDIRVSLEDRRNATITIRKDKSYCYNNDIKIIRVRIGFIDRLLNRSIADVAERRLKKLVVELENENRDIRKLIQWQKDYNNK
jgi:hypothetical protein